MLDILKLRLRISADDFNEEIQELQQAAEDDLKLAGVIDSKFAIDGSQVYTDDLVKRAIIVYVKAHFGWNNPDHEKLLNSYNSLKMHMTLSEEYTEV